GHFLQLSIANHLPDEIRRQHGDGIFIEGWALYGEEMLMRTGLYSTNSASQGQVLRLSRYRAARIGVDVNLHTGRWTFEQAVKYFMDAGGLDREAAEGEAAGAASSPTQKISYITGKWQIMNLLGRYKDKQVENFRLGQFHDDLIKNGSLPVSVVEWVLLDDPTAIQQALKYIPYRRFAACHSEAARGSTIRARWRTEWVIRRALEVSWGPISVNGPLCQRCQFS